MDCTSCLKSPPFHIRYHYNIKLFYTAHKLYCKFNTVMDLAFDFSISYISMLNLFYFFKKNCITSNHFLTPLKIYKYRYKDQHLITNDAI